jgi:excisionase family DNA binding protein
MAETVTGAAEAATAPDTPWLTRNEAASYARVSVRTIDTWAASGKLRRYVADDSRLVRFRREDVDAVMVLKP